MNGGTVFALHRILVPTNLGDPSRTAIHYGVAFARQFGAKLFLLHVLDAQQFDAALETERVLEVLSPDGERPAAEPSALEVARNAARHDLGQLLTPDDERDTRAEYLLRGYGMAGPAEAIVACARELDVELVVMGKHRLGFIEHLSRAASPRRSCAHAPSPVLIVQHPETEFVVASGRAAVARRLTMRRALLLRRFGFDDRSHPRPPNPRLTPISAARSATTSSIVTGSFRLAGRSRSATTNTPTG